jgi:hypothetical protein
MNNLLAAIVARLVALGVGKMQAQDYVSLAHAVGYADGRNDLERPKNKRKKAKRKPRAK